MSATYQPLWRAGQQLTPGERPSADRYKVIADTLHTLAEPFSLMDVGAAGGYFSQRIAEDFDCAVTAVESHRVINDLTHYRVTVVNKRVDHHDLRSLPRHDVVLALSVMHHFADWRSAWNALRACRQWVIAEIPHPDENWMKVSASRHELGAIYDTVRRDATELLGEFERIGRDGVIYQRPMYLVPGTVQRVTGRVFSGSGSCSKRLPEYSNGLDEHLGYQPFMGSLNLHLDHDLHLGQPHVAWVGANGKRLRDYQFWRAWIGDLACHAMVPGKRGHGPDTIEMVAPFKLRDRYDLMDGNPVVVDIELGR